MRIVAHRLLVGASLLLGAGIAGAQPKAPPTPPADPAPPADAAGAPVTPVEEPPPSDMNGTDENPDAPKGTGEEPAKIVVVPPKSSKSGYPIEQVNRPINLPQNMSEVTLDTHAVLGLGDTFYSGAGALHARYGIIREVQLGLTYVVGGIFHQPPDPTMNDPKFKPGKAVGLDVTVLLQDWIGVRVGVPLYIDPVAVGLTLGVPIKFSFADKLAIGGFDDLLDIRIKNFAPSFQSEDLNARQAYNINSNTNTSTSRGALRFSVFGEYQQSSQLAVQLRVGQRFEDFSSNRGNSGYGGTTTFLRAGIQYSPKKFLDVGGTLGWETLADLASFGPQLFLNFRI